ncbi:alpha/beta-hydrolase [Mytilinidion resinicola]|uniref:Alpha/beta-hydrolase n=1 Tax=Mytilinidion resinicola TaxID=574789 RepID=A0A6A6YUK0_9PEZI|nr:alpha/beta-hydrolase [Mytilinidion resinicola]KAF2812199.1 alpha/beta-hydrolase [Mytilinidion resinicola]
MAAQLMPEPSSLATPYGTISYIDSKPALVASPNAPALLLIHGNSSNSQIFRPVFNAPQIATKYRIIALDLPGHGASSNAADPAASYTQAAYAATAVQLLSSLHVSHVVVLGWSLGGHIAIEMMPLLAPSSTATAPETKLLGIMITGTPPCIGLDQMALGFRFPCDPTLLPPGREILTEDEIDGFVHMTAIPYEPWMRDAVARTDGLARKVMFNAGVAGRGLDQRKEVETNTAVAVAVVNGGAEPFVNLDYIDEIKWANLWKGKCVRLEGLQHAPFWEAPDAFRPYLENFLEDLTKQ